MIASNRQGFTLLEVLISLTIVSLALGVIFSLLGESKKLAWAAGRRLDAAIMTRAALNAAYLQEQLDDHQSVLPLNQFDATILSRKTIEPPARQTIPLNFVLEEFSLTSGGREITALRLLRKEPAK